LSIAGKASPRGCPRKLGNNRQSGKENQYEQPREDPPGGRICILISALTALSLNHFVSPEMRDLNPCDEIATNESSLRIFK